MGFRVTCIISASILEYLKLFSTLNDGSYQISITLLHRSLITDFTSISSYLHADSQNYRISESYCEDCMAVACDNDVCTNIGADMLRKGGSGVDATIAILLCLGAVQPESNGIGGWVP